MTPYMNSLPSMYEYVFTDVCMSVPIGDDKGNWMAVWKVLNVSSSVRTDDQNLTVFDKIMITNARQRGKFNCDLQILAIFAQPHICL